MGKENKEQGYWIENTTLSNLLDELNLPEPIRERLENVNDDNVKEGFFMEADPPLLAEAMLEEVFRRVLGFSVNQLNTTDQMEIERLKKEFFGDVYQRRSSTAI